MKLNKFAKASKELIIVGIILGILVFFNYSNLFSIYSESYEFDKTFSSSTLQVQSKSTLPQGESIRIGRSGGYKFVDAQASLMADAPSDCWAIGTCAQNSLTTTFTILVGSNSISSHLTSQGQNARSQSTMPIASETLLILDNKEFNTNIAEELSFSYLTQKQKTQNVDFGGEIILYSDFYLSNAERDILLLSVESSSSGKLELTRNLLGAGYILKINGVPSNLNIPVGIYKLSVKSGYIGTDHTYTYSSPTHTQNIDITNISFKNSNLTSPNVNIVYVYVNQTINQTINQTVTLNQTCENGLSCPGGFKCISGVCVQEIEEPTFLEKYGLAGLILLIMGSIVIFLVMRGKR